MYVENPTAWGTKRICQDCKSKYYDLRRTPVVCPKCQAEFVEPPKAKRATRDPSAVAGRARATPFGHGSGPRSRRPDVHTPFAEASSPSEETPTKVADDGDGEEQGDVEEQDSGDKAEADEEEGEEQSPD